MRIKFLFISLLNFFLISNSFALAKEINILGYGKVSDNNPKLEKSSAQIDLERNILGFSIGWSYTLTENKMILNVDNKYNGKTKITENYLTDKIIVASTKLNISETTKKYLKKLPTVTSTGKSEIKDKNLLESYNQAKNLAINIGLKKYYGENFKGTKSGKIFLQNIISNSLNNPDINNISELTYSIKFSIKDESK